jgi:RNA polymerase sigma factor (sigma-70 family)
MTTKAGGVGTFIRALRVREADRVSDGQLLDRFLIRRDEDAFAALVYRHGRMVLGVCRRVLGNGADADDAFQATFLVLVQRAHALIGREILGDWLHGVARRVALKAKATAARRRHKEQGFARPEANACEARNDWLPLLDEEVSRLPQKLRLPIVLCDLQEKTRPEAAAQLGWPEGTVAGRLAQGRALLAKRLFRRARSLSIGLAVAIPGTVARAGLPPHLLDATVRAATMTATGGQGTSVAALALANGAIRSMILTRLKLALALVLAAALCGTGVGVVGSRQAPASAEERESGGAVLSAQYASHTIREETRQQSGLDRNGDPLPEKALARLGTTRFRQGNGVQSVRFSPDGKSLLLCGNGRGLGLWDVATGKEIRQLSVTGFSVEAVFSADGKTVISAGGNGAFWDVATGKRLKNLTEPGGIVFSLAVSPDGNLVATSDLQKVQIKDLRTGKTIRELDHEARKIVFAADGKSLATAGEKDGTIRLWDIAGGAELRRWQSTPGPYDDNRFLCHGLAAAPAGTSLAHSGGDGRVRLLDGKSGKEVEVLGPVLSRCYAVTFSPDNLLLASAHEDGTIRLFSTANGKLQRSWKTSAVVQSLAFSPDSAVLASAGSSFSGAQIWDAATGKELVPPQGGHLSSVTHLQFARDGKSLLSMAGEAEVFRWDLATAGPPGAPKIAPGRAAAFSPDGKMTVQIEMDENPKSEAHGRTEVKLMSMETGKVIRNLARDVPYYVVFSPDSKLLALASFEWNGQRANGIAVIEIQSGKVSYRFTGSERRSYFGLAFSPDGRKLAAGTWEEKPHFHLWDLETGKKVPSCNPDHWVNSIVFSRDSTLVALSSGGDHHNCVSIWDLATATRIQQIDNQQFSMVAAFSPTGRFLATAGHAHGMIHLQKSEENMVRIWEVSTGKQVAEFGGHHSGVSSLAFAPDGKALASGGGDSQIFLWDVLGRRSRNQSPALLTSAELEARWNVLAGTDTAGAFATIAELVAAGDVAVAFLKSRLAAVPHPDAAQVRRAAELVADLNSDNFAVRQKATTALEKLGSIATPILRKTLADSPTLEVRRRAEKLLTGLEQAETSTWLPQSRALEVVELVGSPQARELLRALAQGNPGARLTREAKAAVDGWSR